ESTGTFFPIAFQTVYTDISRHKKKDAHDRVVVLGSIARPVVAPGIDIIHAYIDTQFGIDLITRVESYRVAGKICIGRDSRLGGIGVGKPEVQLLVTSRQREVVGKGFSQLEKIIQL